MKKYLKLDYLAAILILLSIIIRFWDVPTRFIFDMDVQYQALFAKTIIKDFHILWIGVSAGNVGYYLGPGLVYLTALLLKISRGDPLILGYFSSIIGAGTVLSLYFIISHLFNKKAAFIATTLYGFSYFAIIYDRKFWPFAIPLIGLWIYFSLLKSYKNPWWLFLSIFLISTAYHIHLSLLLFWPFILFTIWQLRKSLKFIHYLSFISTYLLITLPLLIFDFLHNFDNLLAPVRMVFGSGGAGRQFGGSISYMPRLIGNVINYSNTPMIVSLLILKVTILLLIFSVINKKRTLKTAYLSLFILLFITAVVFFPGTLQEYYGVLFVPFFFIFLSLHLQKIKIQLLIPLLTIYVFFNLNLFINQSATNGLKAKKVLVNQVMEKVGDQEYYLAFDDKDYDGWRYLFYAYGRAPEQSDADSQFGWLYQDEISTTKPKVIIKIVPSGGYEYIIEK